MLYATACIIVLFNVRTFLGACPLEYRTIDPHHSYCSQPHPDVTDQELTSSERAYILEMHNDERILTHGTNVEKMYWSDDSAEIALRHARTCLFEHDKASQRSVPRIPLSSGQNLAMGYANWTEVLEGWIEEKEHYYHQLPSTNVFSHYTQMIWHSSVLIGCASTICPPFGSDAIPWHFYVCNYITGALNSNYHAAYKRGVQRQPLHDCQGKVCLYNGTLDLDTCECQCSSYASGSQCENLDCSITPPCPYHSSISCVAVDVPLECPQLCGLCERYEILKQIYGPEDLGPNVPLTPSTTVEQSSKETRATSRKLRTRARTTPATIFSTTNAWYISSGSRMTSASYHTILCLFIKYLFVA